MRERRNFDTKVVMLKKRILYALAGLISGALLSVFTIVPIIYFLFELDVSYQGIPLIVFIPLLFAILMAIWGFIATDRMTDCLAEWWESVIYNINH
ncbi:MAG: hypothetical protein U9O87_01745 [Verrucomicrobiota bacterium]|nr:hypothetical protein [Verrucomicrobiota bacterium]